MTTGKLEKLKPVMDKLYPLREDTTRNDILITEAERAAFLAGIRHKEESIELCFETKDDLITFVNNCMQYKADADAREGRSKEAFTPMYQVMEFLKTINK